MVRKRWMKVAATAALSVGSVGLIGLPAGASSHREAPLTSEDPVADNTDFFMFRDSTDPTKVNIIANFQGFQTPQSGPNFFKFGDDVKYSIHLDNTGDVNDDIVYNFRFRTTITNPDTSLYNTGQVTTPTDADQNTRQVYSIERVDAGGSSIIATDLPVPPSNVGVRSMPDYEDDIATPTIADLGGGAKAFAGTRQDPFFVDTGSAFDLLGLRSLNSAHLLDRPDSDGVDGLAGKNVSTIALQLPINSVSKNGDNPSVVDSKDSILGAYASTSRQRVKVLSVAGEAPRNAGRWVQVSRLAIPLVNEVLIPLSQKDKWNATDPADDAQFFGTILDPEIAKLIPILYPGVDTPEGGLDADGNPRRTDIVAVLTGQGAGLSAANALPPADLLRLNLATPITGSPNRLGVIAGDAQGFPNGRRLADDVTDVELRLLAGGTPLNADFGGTSPNNILGDDVDVDDAANLSTFPYVGTPFDGYSQEEPGNAAP